MRHFLALERVFDEVAPRGRGARGGQRDDAHRGASDRPRPRAPRSCSSSTRSSRTRCGSTRTRCTRRSCRREEVRELTPRGARRGRGLHRASSRRGRRRSAPYRRPRDHAARTLRDFGRHIAVRRAARPRQRVPAAVAVRHRTTCASGRGRWRRRASTPSSIRGRQFVYFPLHVTDDYKIKRVIPHCVDQASLIEQVAAALPHGYDLVLKEHPMSVGRNQPRRCCGGWRGSRTCGCSTPTRARTS